MPEPLACRPVALGRRAKGELLKRARGVHRFDATRKDAVRNIRPVPIGYIAAQIE